MSTTDDRPLQQRRQALTIANEVRYTRAAFKRELKDGTRRAGLRRAADLIENPPWWAATWQVAELLQAVPRVGTRHALAACNQIDALPTRRLRDLTPRQRTALAQHLQRQARNHPERKP